MKGEGWRQSREPLWRDTDGFTIGRAPQLQGRPGRHFPRFDAIEPRLGLLQVGNLAQPYVEARFGTVTLLAQRAFLGLHDAQRFFGDDDTEIGICHSQREILAGVIELRFRELALLTPLPLRGAAALS